MFIEVPLTTRDGVLAVSRYQRYRIATITRIDESRPLPP
jgi:hypothetical protein